MDIDRIQGGDNFVQAIRNTLEVTGVVLVVIGRNWLAISEEDNRPRLDNPEDYVRLEIASALSASIQVIPVLVEGARMPQEGVLPANLKTLAQLNAVLISDERWASDTNRLAKILELDVPGSIAERRFRYLKKWVLALLFISVSCSVLTSTFVSYILGHYNSTKLELAVIFFKYLNLLIMTSVSILLPIAARSVDDRNKQLMWLCLSFAGLSVVLSALEYALFSVVTNTAILVALNMSTFKPK